MAEAKAVKGQKLKLCEGGSQSCERAEAEAV